ncbi:MAG TPA: hypothetical protein DIU15_06290 [Deltaproteobacteria bacterium]|nr:hypothetical protein [Deltaproteobacteria bacterium]
MMMRLAAVVVGLALASVGISPALAAGDLANGAVVYKKACEQCHGVDGAGDGPAATFMLPRPRIFKENSSYKFRTTPSGELPTDQDLFDIISRGLPGTSMPPFSALTEQERWDLVVFIKSLSEDFADPDYTSTAIPMPELTNAQPPPVTPELLAKGKELWDINQCAKCHGEYGRGNGTSWPDLQDDWTNPDTGKRTYILPANLTNLESYRGGSSSFDIYRTISTGLNGTPMPAYSDSIPPADRWALVAYVESLAPPRKESRDDTVMAVRVASMPESGSDGAWDAVPAARFQTHSNVIEAPRLFWSSVEFVTAQAVFNDDEIAMRIQWDDRSHSKGTDDETVYEDRDGRILRQTPHPDQFAVQFPAKNDPKARPYILMGDKKRPVNLWWWRADKGEGLVEMNAKGWDQFTTQDDSGQGLSGAVTYDDGRYTMFVRRTLVTETASQDIQFVPGRFVPIGFNVWDGDRGELGQRRSMTTWYWLYLQPDTPMRAYTLPPVAFLLTLVLLGFIVARTQRLEAAIVGDDDTQSAA